MTIRNIKLLSEFLNKALQVRRLLEKFSSFEDKALTLLQTQALKFINLNTETSIGSLAKELNISLSSTTQLTNRLVGGGWVNRKNDPNDRRIITLSLSPNGQKQLQVSTKKLFSSHYALLTSIPESDLKEMVRIFTNILNSQKKTLI